MPPLAKRAAAALACLLVAAAPASGAFAWGATGHRLIGQLGEAALPADLPAFLRTPQAIEAVGEYAREPDRWRAAGRVHDTERDPAHFLDLDDDGRIFWAVRRWPPCRRPARTMTPPCARSAPTAAGRLSALCDRRRLAAAGQGFRLLADPDRGHPARDRSPSAGPGWSATWLGARR